ncbi:MAG: antibiotic biosynthesis monooxygenase family protein [Steroidobacteraceae bacterium]
METVLIDVFVVPEEARQEFLSKVHFSADYLKTLPGFVEGYVYERATGTGRFNIVTTAVWESEKATGEAKKSAAAFFQQVGFNPPEIMKRLGVQIERAEYWRKPY